MALASSQYDSPAEGRRYAWGTRTGERTAANFTITLGFTPSKIRVVNLTDRVEATHYINSALDDGSNAKSLKTVAAGTRTYEACGIALDDGGRSFTVTVATAGLETDDDDVLWEAWE